MKSRSYSRWAPLRGAAWFALGFIALRVAYRVIFLGASGSGWVIWSGRPIHLDGPFRMISLFGPVTTGGLWSSIMDALPFALGILGFGLLFAWVDVRRFLALAARARLARGMLTALAIGVSTYPALVTSWRSMREIHRLRRERGGFSVLGPLFERTLERASTMGTSMETRGFGRRVAAPELDCSQPLTVVDLSLSHGLQHVLAHASFTIGLGELVLLSGATGSGKSTLLRAIAGLHAEVEHGAISVGGANRALVSLSNTAGFVGYLPQNARESFVAPTVYEEVAFSLISQGFSNALAAVRVHEVLEQLRIARLADRSVESLSSGEAVLVALGATLSTRPTLLLLDEPFADLDVDQALYVRTALERLAHGTQISIVVAEHRIDLMTPIADRRLHIGGSFSLTEVPITFVAPQAGLIARPAVESPDRIGAICALTGPNGSGKTSQFFSLARDRPGRRALVPESLGDYFVRDSVAAECHRSDHTARVDSGTTLALYRRLIGAKNVELERHPRSLSAGQQLSLAIAIALAARPEEILIDEPTRGLDSDVRAELAILLREIAETTLVSIASHDSAFVELLGARVQEVSA